MKAIIPAAGLGTRFLPVTKSQPKEMLPIVDKPALQYVVEEAIAANIHTLLMITGRSKRAIEDYFDKNIELEHYDNGRSDDDLRSIGQILNDAKFYYVRQKEPKGLGDAILCARHFIGSEHFAVLLGDDIILDENCTAEIMRIHEKTGASVVAVEEINDSRISNYGVVDADEIKDGTYHVKGMVEKPSQSDAPSNLAMVGRYILTPEIFNCIEKTKPDASGEVQLTDAMQMLNQKEDIIAYKVRGKRLDIGSKIGWMKATLEMAMRRPEFSHDLKEYMKELVEKN